MTTLRIAVIDEGEEILELFCEIDSFLDPWAPSIAASWFFHMHLDEVGIDTAFVAIVWNILFTDHNQSKS
uniref:Uncharacterized protein n=1 Tax=Acrobeloides nanus TaxID=290746 RepID=A0A914CXJ4_9BILA